MFHRTFTGGGKMNASRILPTLAFSVAVSFFFVPPVIAIVKNAPAVATPTQTSSLIVKSTPVSTSQPAMSTRIKAAPAKEMCAPTEASSRAPHAAPAGEFGIVGIEELALELLGRSFSGRPLNGGFAHSRDRRPCFGTLRRPSLLR